MHVERSFVARAVTVVGIAAFVVVALLLLWVARTWFLLTFAGLLVALILRGASDWLAARSAHLPERVSLALVVVGILILLTTVVWLIAPNLADQVDRLSEAVPRALERLEDKITRYSWGRKLVENVSDGQIWAGGSNPMGQITGVFSTTLGILGNVAIVVFIGLFLAVNPRLYFRGALRLLPKERRERTGEILAETGHTLQRWFVGTMLSASFIGVGSGIGLALLGVPLALTLAILATLLTFIPYIGPIVSAVPAVLVALLEDPLLAVWVVVLYASLQFLESYIVTPLIQKRAVHVPPALLLSGQVVFGLVFGLLGVVLATPAMAALLVIVRRAYVEDVLGDRDEQHE